MHCVLHSVLPYHMYFLMIEKKVSFSLEKGVAPFTNDTAIFAVRGGVRGQFLKTKSPSLALSFFVAGSILQSVMEFNNWEREKVEFWLYIEDLDGYPIANCLFEVRKFGEVFRIADCMLFDTVSPENVPLYVVASVARVLHYMCVENNILDVMKFKYQLHVKSVRR